MEAQDIRFIENPFEKIFNIVSPETKKLYALRMTLIQEFFNNVKIPTLSDYASDPNQVRNDISAYSGANGYLYTLIRLYRYFNKEKANQFEQYSRQSHIKSDVQLNKFMDPDFYLQKTIQQYNMLKNQIQKKKKSKHLSFYMSEVCTWVSGMHIGYDTRNHGMFRENQAKMLECYQTIRQNSKNMMWQILYGIPGYLFAVLELQHAYDSLEQQLFRTNFAPISKQLTKMTIHQGIVAFQRISGKKVNFQMSLPEDFRLVYTFHQKEYLGGAHGVGGVLNTVLLSIQMNKFDFHEIQNFIKVIHPSIIFLLKHFINGNFTTSLGSQKTKLVHFCHGAPGIVYALARYSELFPQKALELGLADVIERALNHIWKYGVLKKGFGLCHGISGNAYAFLSKSIWNILPDKAEQYRKKATLFALLRQQKGVINQIRNYNFNDRYVKGKSDNPFSLMLGIGGDICFAIDCAQGVNRFPGFNFDL